MQFRKESISIFKQLFLAFIIYLMIIPIVFADICFELYHRISFPLYGFKYVKRSDYIRIDRQKLSYLHPLEKFNCAYCGYANGVAAYFVKIAGETERFWCSIRHKQNGSFQEPAHHVGFLPYDDEESFKEFLKK